MVHVASSVSGDIHAPLFSDCYGNLINSGNLNGGTGHFSNCEEDSDEDVDDADYDYGSLV